MLISKPTKCHDFVYKIEDVRACFEWHYDAEPMRNGDGYVNPTIQAKWCDFKRGWAACAKTDPTAIK